MEHDEANQGGPTGADNHVLKIKPPLTFTAGDADLFVSVLDEVLDRDW